jgi:PhnB protein
MKSVTSYLSFDGNCRQAITFYRECLGGELTINAYPDASGQPSADPGAKVMHAQLALQGAPLLMASDSPQPGTLQQGNNFSVSIDCDSRSEVERLFASLAGQGEVRMPLMDAPWGAVFGMLTDQFGVQWLLNCFVAKASS